MELQAALDFFSTKDALALMDKIHPYVDIAEIGTPLMVSEGFGAVSIMKEKYPSIKVLADMKLMDGGKPIAAHALDAGADIVTVLGLTNNATIAGAVEAAHERNKAVCVDTIGIDSAILGERTRELEEMGVDYIAVHTAHDMLHCINTPIEALKVIKNNLHTGRCKSVISGGISPESIPEIAEVGPDVVIVGRSLTKAKDPVAVARSLRSYII